ncbi:hypothetical protein RIF23_16040 [Lipingzhangella sp. LS1_29]|uniref:Uncharacterized protein n=1 Tax=Lipingzhangella rawalii TaxID=2055835 RepID=A0ABU2HB35_9ACTN|nr:hypothetical protein [Lipingzhangella rawalii]MDS1271804.1 hypothetical protein [Lipingzhangella rawalii]
MKRWRRSPARAGAVGAIPFLGEFPSEDLDNVLAGFDLAGGQFLDAGQEAVPATAAQDEHVHTVMDYGAAHVVDPIVVGVPDQAIEVVVYGSDVSGPRAG